MARYNANAAKAYESSGGNSFRLQKDGDKARVVFLYSNPESIDGWACHRFTKGKSGYTYTVDCPRGPKDPLEKCPACADKQALYTRVFVRILNLGTNEVTIWDRASSFRRDLVGMMEYFNPLYGRVYEITRRGSGLQTQYQYQSLGESGITPEKYEELVQKAEEVAAEYVRPIDSYQTVLAACQSAMEQDASEGVQVDNSQQNAWGQPQPGTWGQPPAGNWGQPQPVPANPAPVNPVPANPVPQPGNWGQPPQPVGSQNQVNPSTQQVNQTPQQGGWGQPPVGNWGQPPQTWGQNSGN